MGLRWLAEASDIELLAMWHRQFDKDVRRTDGTISPEEELKNAEKRVLEGKTYFWIRDTMPVCMAAQARPTVNGIAINGVFTPAEHRCRGYASVPVGSGESDEPRFRQEILYPLHRFGQPYLKFNLSEDRI
jgi:predicted GNAT family acetyltransferase